MPKYNGLQPPVFSTILSSSFPQTKSCPFSKVSRTGSTSEWVTLEEALQKWPSTIIVIYWLQCYFIWILFGLHIHRNNPYLFII